MQVVDYVLAQNLVNASLVSSAMEHPAQSLLHHVVCRFDVLGCRRVTDDSAFPFEPGDELVVTVDPKGKRLILEKAYSATVTHVRATSVKSARFFPKRFARLA